MLTHQKRVRIGLLWPIWISPERLSPGGAGVCPLSPPLSRPAGERGGAKVSWSSFFVQTDRLFDCRLLLEGIGWQVAQFGVQPLAVVEVDEVIEALDIWHDGKEGTEYHYDDRMLLEVSMWAKGARLTNHLAMNEVVIEKSEAGHTVRLGVDIDKASFTTYAADGLILATPTGSTAYSMSARGPILSPRLRAILMTPVSPHMLFDRSMVLDPQELIRIEILGHRSVNVATDGELVHTLRPGDVVEVRAAQEVARFVRFKEQRFHQTLKSKFGLSDR
mgnify:CR=1 FL=1